MGLRYIQDGNNLNRQITDEEGNVTNKNISGTPKNMPPGNKAKLINDLKGNVTTGPLTVNPGERNPTDLDAAVGILNSIGNKVGNLPGVNQMLDNSDKTWAKENPGLAELGRSSSPMADWAIDRLEQTPHMTGPVNEALTPPKPSPAEAIDKYAMTIAEKVYNTAWQSFSKHMANALPPLPWDDIPSDIEQEEKLSFNPSIPYMHGVGEPTDATYVEGKNTLINNVLDSGKKGGEFQEIFRKLNLLETWNKQNNTNG
tara:strand:+ start:403 stop:1173 length:771 start_codon:yes stop_codon:yes gene_type:complete